VRPELTIFLATLSTVILPVPEEVTLLAAGFAVRLGRVSFAGAFAATFVAEHGARAIVIGRFFVGLRGFIYFAVGASRYPFGPFLAIDAAAGVVEIGGLVALGFGLGELRARVGESVDLAVAGVLLVALFGPLALRLRRRKAQQVSP
jgi:membrane protein DedA with SNARE-associated domain